jgi:hypothetical protein
MQQEQWCGRSSEFGVVSNFFQRREMIAELSRTPLVRQQFPKGASNPKCPGVCQRISIR